VCVLKVKRLGLGIFDNLEGRSFSHLVSYRQIGPQIDILARNLNDKDMKIGWFYDTLDAYKAGRHSKVGIVDEWGSYIRPVPEGVDLDKLLYHTDERGYSHSDEMLIELMPSIALSTVTLYDDCGETHPCRCVLDCA
jgi:hypothetical protein